MFRILSSFSKQSQLQLQSQPPSQLQSLQSQAQPQDEQEHEQEYEYEHEHEHEHEHEREHDREHDREQLKQEKPQEKAKAQNQAQKQQEQQEQQREHDENLNVNLNSNSDYQPETKLHSTRSIYNNFESKNINDSISLEKNSRSLNAEQSMFDSSSSFADLIETKRIAAQLRGIIDDNKKLKTLKGSDELILKLEEILREIDEQSDKILVTVKTSVTVQYNLKSLHTSLQDVKSFFDGNPRQSFFGSKSKLQRRVQDFYHTLRAKCTQLMTSVSLELLTSGGKSIVAAPSSPSVQARRVHMLLREGEASLWGHNGRGGMNHSVARSRFQQAADMGSTNAMLLQARLIISKCRGHRIAQSVNLDDDENDDEEDAMALLERVVVVQEEEKEEEQLDMEASSRHVSIQAQAKVELAALLLDRIQREASFQWSRVQWQEDTGSDDEQSQPWGRVTVYIHDTSLTEKVSEQSDLLLQQQLDSMQQAVDFLISAAEQGAVSAITQLGLGFLLLSDGRRRATRCLSLAASLGCSLASAALGKIFLDDAEDELEREGELKGGVGNKNVKRAITSFQAASSGGHPGGWLGQGVCCEMGIGVSLDMDKAIGLYRRAIAAFDSSFGVGGVFDQSLPWNWDGLRGLATACYKLGRLSVEMYPRVGTELQPIPTSAAEKHQSFLTASLNALRRAESMGFPAASFLLGQLCEMGLVGMDMGLITDPTLLAAQKMMALSHYKTAAQLGHDTAALCAGHLTYALLQADAGEQGQLAWSRAVAFYEQAAAGGSAEAMNCLGLLLEDGRAETDSFASDDLTFAGLFQKRAAATWYIESIRLGFEPALVNLTLLLCSGDLQGSIPVVNKDKEMTVKQLRLWVLTLIQERCTPDKGNNNREDDGSDAEMARWRSLEAMLEGECKLDGADGEEEDCSSYWDEMDHPNTTSNNNRVEGIAAAGRSENQSVIRPVQQEEKSNHERRNIAYRTDGPILPPSYVPKVTLDSIPSSTCLPPPKKSKEVTNLLPGPTSRRNDVSTLSSGVSLLEPQILV